MTGPSAIGSAPAHAAALAAAFNTANEYVNFQSGAAPGPALPSGYYASTTELNTLADVIAACVDTSGIITTIAGNGARDYSGDGGAATLAALNNPGGVAVDGSGNVYIADSVNNVSRMVNTSGIISTVAGTGSTTYSPSEEGGSPLNATLNNPLGLAIDTSGNLVIADSSHRRIRRVTASAGIVTIAGNGSTGYTATQDGGPATAASLATPSAIAFDSNGNLYIADYGNNRVRKVTDGGTISTFAGNGGTAYNASQDGGPATSAAVYGPRGVAADASGNIYITDTRNNRLRKVDSSGNISTLAGSNSAAYQPSQEGVPSTAANLSQPYGITTDGAGNIYVADTGNYRVRKINTSGNINTVAGNGASNYSSASDGHVATQAQLYQEFGVTTDASGNVYIADTFNNRIRKVDTNGIITTVAGNGDFGYTASQDGGPAVNASLAYPSGVAVDTAGNLYIADAYNNRIRKVTPSGTISTFAGTGNSAYDTSQESIAATSANLSTPFAVATDGSGNLYIADTNNNLVRKVDNHGIITSIAGNATAGFGGDRAPATAANINNPYGVAVDAAGNVYIADTNNNRIRKVDTGGTITTVAGNGTAGYNASDDGGAATSGSLNAPRGVAVDTNGNLYIADLNNVRIRKVDTSATLTTVAGNGNGGENGDGGPATSATLSAPYGLAVDLSGNLYIADTLNNVIRKVTH